MSQTTFFNKLFLSFLYCITIEKDKKKFNNPIIAFDYSVRFCFLNTYMQTNNNALLIIMFDPERGNTTTH